MPDILIAEFMDDAAVERLRAAYDTLYDPGLVDRPAELAGQLVDARALIVRNRTRVCCDLLSTGGQLQCVGRLGVGLDNIDVAACRTAGVAVFPANGANDLAVAEYVVTAAMMLLRRAYGAKDRMLAGEWPRQALIGGELSGRVVGLVGFGAIAREVGARASALGMSVIAHDPYLPDDAEAWRHARSVSLETLLAEADVVSLHTPLTDATRHLIDATALGRMKRGAVLVNAARGGVVDETALANALSQKRIAGAALDVFEIEPLTAEAATKFAGLENLILTPHIAGVTEESNVRVSALVADKVLAHLKASA